MGYFVIIAFTTFLGSPPEMLPVAFKNSADCESYLVEQVKKKFKYMQINEGQDSKYLTDITKSKFVICKQLKYPITKNSI